MLSFYSRSVKNDGAIDPYEKNSSPFFFLVLLVRRNRRPKIRNVSLLRLSQGYENAQEASTKRLSSTTSSPLSRPGSAFLRTELALLHVKKGETRTRPSSP